MVTLPLEILPTDMMVLYPSGFGIRTYALNVHLYFK